MLRPSISNHDRLSQKGPFWGTSCLYHHIHLPFIAPTAAGTRQLLPRATLWYVATPGLRHVPSATMPHWKNRRPPWWSWPSLSWRMSSESKRCYYPLLIQPVRHKPVEIVVILCAVVLVTEAGYSSDWEGDLRWILNSWKTVTGRCVNTLPATSTYEFIVH